MTWQAISARPIYYCHVIDTHFGSSMLALHGTPRRGELSNICQALPILVAPKLAYYALTPKLA